MISILLVEDEVAVAEVLKLTLEHNSKFVVFIVPMLADGIRVLKARVITFDIVLLDLSLPDSKGEATLRTFQKECPEYPFIVVTGGASFEGNPIMYGAQDFIVKGDQTYTSMEQIITHAIERHKVRSIFTPITELLQEAKQMVNDMKVELKDDKQKAGDK